MGDIINASANDPPRIVESTRPVFSVVVLLGRSGVSDASIVFFVREDVEWFSLDVAR